MSDPAAFGWLGVDSWTEFWWVAVGLGGQLMFTARFLVQWIASERVGRSVVPLAFWYLSISGGLILLAYAIWRRDPVFILGQSMGLIVYLRNLVLIHAERRRTPE
jgi:lipid-A-disaccharide synthase-like uncharacterized protein